MKKLLNITFCLLLGTALSGQSLERQVVGSAGSAFTSNNAYLSFTTGEVATNSSITGSGILTQGFQQAEEEDFVGVVDIQNLDAKTTLFPNPAVDILKIKSDLPGQGIMELQYTILDIQGRIILNGAVASNEGSIAVSSIAKATYIIELKSSDGRFTKRIRFTKM